MPDVESVHFILLFCCNSYVKREHLCYSVSIISELGADRMKPPTGSGSGGATVSRFGGAWVKHKLQEINPHVFAQFCSA